MATFIDPENGINFIECKTWEEAEFVSNWFIDQGYVWCSGLTEFEYVMEEIESRGDPFPIVIGEFPDEFFDNKSIYYRKIDDICSFDRPYTVISFEDAFRDKENTRKIICGYVDVVPLEIENLF